MTTTAPDTRPAPVAPDDPAATAVELLKAEVPVDAITKETGLSVGEVIAAAEAAGLTRKPDLAALGKELAEALEWGRHHDNAKVRALADKARTALFDLSRWRRNEAVITQAESEIATLRQQLAAAEDKLRNARGGTAGGKGTASASSLTRTERVECRQWARLNGHTVGDHGVIPHAIVAAWRKSTANSAG
jgi:hypothetical protein